ncbi:MAG TPA: PepSY domain-containing protein [Methylotenera sp.]|nr:PepSY domain-containing protein [Methylotenera sp.]HPH04657.1 PepSY domain-containing protein [Methylotenera sp.]
MQKKLIVALFALAAVPAFAGGHTHQGRMETCMRAALAKHPGEVISLEAEVEKGRGAIYEFDIKGADGVEWEVECVAKTGKVYEEEIDVDPNSADFTSKAKVSMEDAKATALAKYPGEVVSTEYELEDGNPIYEFDIKRAKGNEIEVEVDAVTGKIGETEEEIYEIGKD